MDTMLSRIPIFIVLHRTYTEEPVLINLKDILYIKDVFFTLPGKIETEKGTEVCLKGYDYSYDKKGHSYKSRIKFCVVESVEQILKMVSNYANKNQ